MKPLPQAALLFGALLLAVPVAAAERLSAVQLFALADTRVAEHRPRDAEAIFDALRRDPDAEVRAEARFREATMFVGAKRYRQAASLFRALLDEKPGATRVRLELARVLALMGDEDGAHRELRQARAAGLPADVALAVDRFSRALHTTRRFGGSFELALAPDSNVNRATQARTLDTVIAPLTLSRDARAHTGLGVDFAAQGYARVAVGDRLWLVPHVATRGDLYRQDRFNDVSASALLGLEWDVGRDRISPSVGQTWRWYGGPLYARTRTATVDWLHPAGPRAQWDVQLSASRARFPRIALQDGGLFNLVISYDRALGLRSGVTLSADALRQAAADSGYSTWSGGGSALAWRSFGARTMFLSAGLHRLEGDEALFLFPERRREWLTQVTGGVSFRKLQLGGLAPLVRLGWEHNGSTVGLYRYTRLSAQVGATRAF